MKGPARLEAVRRGEPEKWRRRGEQLREASEVSGVPVAVLAVVGV